MPRPRPASGKLAAAKPGGAGTSALRRILIVEDDPDMQFIASFALKRADFEVDVAGDGREALEKAVRLRPDLILLDVMLPFMDGPAILAELRQREGVAGTPVMFMTARTHPDEVAEYRRLGCLEVIAKPFDPMTLGQTIRGIWDRSHRTAVNAGADEEMAELEALYLRQLPQRVSEILAMAASAGDRSGVDALFHLAHRLTGSSATLGFHQVSDAARAVENVAFAWREKPRNRTARSRRALETLLAKLGRAAEEAGTAQKLPETRPRPPARRRSKRAR
jgi:two-component system OmpR family response regulator